MVRCHYFNNKKMEQINYKYNGDFSDIVSISENKKQVIVNAISITKTMEHASRELGISQRNLMVYCKEHNIDHDAQKLMRRKFEASGKKVKRRFNI